MQPAGFALLAGDASVVSGFREILVRHEPGVFIQRLDLIFMRRIVLVWGRLEPQRCHQPPTLPLYYVGKMKQTIFLETLCAY